MKASIRRRGTINATTLEKCMGLPLSHWTERNLESIASLFGIDEYLLRKDIAEDKVLASTFAQYSEAVKRFHITKPSAVGTVISRITANPAAYSNPLPIEKEQWTSLDHQAFFVVAIKRWLADRPNSLLQQLGVTVPLATWGLSWIFSRIIVKNFHPSTHKKLTNGLVRRKKQFMAAQDKARARMAFIPTNNVTVTEARQQGQEQSVRDDVARQNSTPNRHKRTKKNVPTVAFLPRVEEAELPPPEPSNEIAMFDATPVSSLTLRPAPPRPSSLAKVPRSQRLASLGVNIADHFAEYKRIGAQERTADAELLAARQWHTHLTPLQLLESLQQPEHYASHQLYLRLLGCLKAAALAFFRDFRHVDRKELSSIKSTVLRSLGSPTSPSPDLVNATNVEVLLINDSDDPWLCRHHNLQQVGHIQE